MGGHTAVGASTAELPPVEAVARSRERLARIGRWAAPAARGMAIGAVVVAIGAAVYAGQNLHLFGPIGSGAIGLGVIVLAMGVLHVVLRAAGWLLARVLGRYPAARSISSLLARPLLATTAFIVLVLWLAPNGGPLAPFQALASFEILIGAGALAGLLAGAAWAVRTSSLPALPRRIAAVALVVPALAIGAGVGSWAVLPGSGDLIVRESAAALAAVPRLDLADPSAPGPYTVVEATYGSGTDGRRAEFGADADWTTPTVDASGVLRRPGGVQAAYADMLWGFGTNALPLNALVWYPSEPIGRLPVVAIVHGNHAAGEPSDPGYAYLGRHLASHGMLAISIDENFLNGDAFFDYAGSEMGVRAWFVLRHLEQLRTWDGSAGHPLAGRVDLDRVALIGHSRGGEAVALAAAFEAGDHDVRGMPPLPRGFGIRAVVAIAPSDGMYRGTPVEMTDVDYLVIQGAHDGDLPAFSGLATYHRVTFSGDGDHLKVALYSQRANHGRFNTVWDVGDAGPLASWMLDRGSLLSPDEQQRLAKTAIGAFLARSLGGETDYDAFFRDPRSGRAWLPDDVIETHWASSGRVAAGDLGAEALSADGPIRPVGFGAADNVDPMLRDGLVQGDRALRVAWSSASSVEIAIGDDVAARVDPDGFLALSIGAAGPGPVPQPELELRSADGETAIVAMRAVAPARPVLPVHLWKLDWLGQRYLPSERIEWPAERFLQTYAIELGRFAEANPALDLDRLESVTLRFSGSGEAYVDDVAFEPG